MHPAAAAFKVAICWAFGRVSDGTRTHDRLDHNQELYQLSYAHRGTDQSTSDGRWSADQMAGPLQRMMAGGEMQPPQTMDDPTGRPWQVPALAGAPEGDQGQPGKCHRDHTQSFGVSGRSCRAAPKVVNLGRPMRPGWTRIAPVGRPPRVHLRTSRPGDRPTGVCRETVHLARAGLGTRLRGSAAQIRAHGTRLCWLSRATIGSLPVHRGARPTVSLWHLHDATRWISAADHTRPGPWAAAGFPNELLARRGVGTPHARCNHRCDPDGARPRARHRHPSLPSAVRAPGRCRG